MLVLMLVLMQAMIKNNLKDNVILLKGMHDKIISAKKSAINKTGSAGMSVGGTGDLLSGMAAGFVSQGMNLFDSAHSAAYFLGNIGKKLEKSLGNGLIASDFLSEIAKEIKRYKNSKKARNK